jgi:conjugative relaxase-like TrwC/TraI family protein
MLRIIQNRSPASAASYYSHAEYYGEGQEKAGIWGGKTAQMLGLEGRIQESDFQALCNNLDPRTGHQLTARQNTDRTVGYDFNWHVPKGVTLAYAVGGDKRIEAIVERSVNETMLEMEQEAKTRVRIGGKQENRTTGNLVWGHFLHTTTRPDDKGEVDPHLHIHCFVFNVTHDDKENRFKAAQFRDLKRDAGYFEARMHARLAKGLREELGYSIERDGRHWDIAGFSKATKKKFSRRTTEIEKLAKEKGITSPEKKAELGARTRNTKSGHESFSTLQENWRSRLDADEEKQFNNLTSASAGTVNGPATAQQAVQQAFEHCFERESVVPERQVLAEALRKGVGTIGVHEVIPEAVRQRLLTRELEGRRMSTLPEVLADETAVLKFARDSRHTVEPLNPHWKPEVDWLSDEQVHAVRCLTQSDDRMQLLLGGAGTGKTTLMSQAVAAIEAGGHSVFTFAPSADASRKVLRDEGFASATTVAELLINENLQREVRDSVIWIDEASLLGTRQLRKVVELVERSNARLILSGDWKRQHGSVQRGGVLGLLDRYAGITPIQIETIRRQQGEYREAIAAMAGGQLQQGFDRLDRLGWVHELDNDIRDRRIANDYANTVMAEESALVVSPTHREAEHLCAAIRETLRERGKITGPDHQVQALVPLHLTLGERQDPAFLREGDVVVFHQNSKGNRKGSRMTIGNTISKAPTDQAERFSVYRPSALSLAVGDKLRITAGGLTKDRKHRLNNGAVYEVAAFSRNGDITLNNGWTIDAEFGHLAQGFVTTSHASQGRTVDHAFIAVSAESFGAAGREQMYVSASRGRRSAHIYTNNKAELREVILESSAKMTATELFQPQQQLDRHKKQQLAAMTPAPVKQKTKELAYDY